MQPTQGKGPAQDRYTCRKSVSAWQVKNRAHQPLSAQLQSLIAAWSLWQGLCHDEGSADICRWATVSTAAVQRRWMFLNYPALSN